MARKSAKKIDITTAQVADGALKAPRSVYEIVGVKNVSYRERTYASYQSQLRKMDLVELHDHAYEVGSVPSPSKEITIDRLERKYLQENPAERAALIEARDKAALEPEELSVHEQAQRIVARGR